MFRQSLVSMLVSSRDHKEKQVVNNILEEIKVHIILGFEAISFRQRKVIAILSYSFVFMFISHVTMSRNSLVCNIIKVTEIHSLHKFGAILVKQYRVKEVFIPKPCVHVGDLRHILNSQ